MQFIAIEITIMHKIQIEWNSIRHFPMGLCREGGRSPVPLWVFHWVWMQCTSSLVISEIRIKKCTVSPPLFLSVNPHVRSRKPGDSDYYKRCLICGEFEARKLRLYRMLVLAREKWRKEGREEMTRLEVWTGSWRHLSLPESWGRLRRKVTNLPFILNFAAGAKTSVCFQKFGLNLIINKWCLASGFTQRFPSSER